MAGKIRLTERKITSPKALQLVRAASPAAYQLWRLFMARSAYRFRIGPYNLYQTLLVKPDHGASHLRLARSGWHTGISARVRVFT
jgi:hypothetical protein